MYKLNLVVKGTEKQIEKALDYLGQGIEIVKLESQKLK